MSMTYHKNPRKPLKLPSRNTFMRLPIVFVTRLVRASAFFAAVSTLGAGLTGCSLEVPGNITPGPAWQITALPEALCVNDTVRIKYRIGDECPAGYDCSALYPRIRVSSSMPMLFSMPEYRAAAFSGEILSNPIEAAGVSTINVSSYFPLLVWRDAHGEMVSTRAPDVTLTIDPMGSGAQTVKAVTFNGRCFGHALGWNAVSFDVGTARSERVRIRRLRNTDTHRVTYTAHFPSGFPDQELTLEPGAAMDIPTEVGPAVIGSLSARISDTAPGDFTMCSDSTMLSPPSPIRSEVTMGCD